MVEGGKIGIPVHFASLSDRDSNNTLSQRRNVQIESSPESDTKHINAIQGVKIHNSSRSKSRSYLAMLPKKKQVTVNNVKLTDNFVKNTTEFDSVSAAYKYTINQNNNSYDKDLESEFSDCKFQFSICF